MISWQNHAGHCFLCALTCCQGSVSTRIVLYDRFASFGVRTTEWDAAQGMSRGIRKFFEG